MVMVEIGKKFFLFKYKLINYLSLEITYSF